MQSEQDVFSATYRRYFPKVFRLCKGYCNGDEATATDLCQEVFMKVWQHRADFRKEAAPGTWIYKIAVNTCLLHLRKASTQREVSTGHLPDSPDEPTEADERLNQLYACISRLNNPDRVLILMVLDGLEYAEIADVMGIAEGTLRVRIHRIKKTLTTCVKP